MTSHNQEIEIKLAAGSVDEAESRLRNHGFRVVTPRAFEANDLYDFPNALLRKRRELLRVREFDGECLLTYKGPPMPGRHKSTQEIETKVSDGAALREVFTRLGLELAFRYEKYRTEWAREGEPGHATLDETPIGVFLELEGEAEWIDATAEALGFSAEHYITANYASLYLDFCNKTGVPPSYMTF